MSAPDGVLQDKVAIVTGGGRGMGRAIANAFAAEGADVAIIERMTDHFEKVRTDVEGHGRRFFAVHMDLTDIGRIPEAYAAVIDELGDLDILMNNAGVSPEGPALETTEEAWDEAMDVNAKALFFSAQAAGRYFLEQGKPGKIINTSSTYGITVEPGLAAYAASKGAVLQITRALASEWAKDRINVNAIGPTLIHTDLTHELFADTEYITKFMKYIPAGVLPKPAHVADVVVFLASPASDFVHGHLIPIDSGELIR